DAGDVQRNDEVGQLEAGDLPWNDEVGQLEAGDLPRNDEIGQLEAGDLLWNDEIDQLEAGDVPWNDEIGQLEAGDLPPRLRCPNPTPNVIEERFGCSVSRASRTFFILCATALSPARPLNSRAFAAHYKGGQHARFRNNRRSWCQ